MLSFLLQLKVMPLKEEAWKLAAVTMWVSPHGSPSLEQRLG